MEVAIILKSPEFSGKVDEDNVIYADAGYNHAQKIGKKNVLAVVGDFDSLGSAPLFEKTVQLNVEKNFTDGERAVRYAKEVGAKTACITTSKGSVLANLVEYPIEAVTGQEVISGSTRMKSGTAQKLICNMLSTGSMIKMGKVYGNYMIDVMATNEKLVARSYGIVSEITGCTLEEAKEKIEKYGTIKKALIAYFTGCEDLEVIEDALQSVKGNIRNAIAKIKGE